MDESVDLLLCVVTVRIHRCRELGKAFQMDSKEDRDRAVDFPAFSNM
jgi:hypothetical protein